MRLFLFHRARNLWIKSVIFMSVKDERRRNAEEFMWLVSVDAVRLLLHANDRGRAFESKLRQRCRDVEENSKTFKTASGKMFFSAGQIKSSCCRLEFTSGKAHCRTFTAGLMQTPR